MAPSNPIRIMLEFPISDKELKERLERRLIEMS